MAGCKGPCYSEFQLATLRCDPYVCVVRSTATAVVTPIRCVICRCTLLIGILRECYLWLLASVSVILCFSDILTYDRMFA